jgi:hypothetical protein
VEGKMRNLLNIRDFLAQKRTKAKKKPPVSQPAVLVEQSGGNYAPFMRLSQRS